MATFTVPDTVVPFAGASIDAEKGPFWTVMFTTAGLGSFAPRLSTAVNDTAYDPGALKMTLPGIFSVLVAGVPLGKIHWYEATVPSGSVALPAKFTACPTLTVTSEAGLVIVPKGGWVVGVGEIWMNLAAGGTPVLAMRQGMVCR